MKFMTVLAALAFTAVVTAEPLNRRACNPTNCVCNGIQGQFCGNENINSACTNGHVFECNGDDSHACDYGVRTSCQNCGQLQC
ncbi:hypothetical protein L218DRAFT_625107 [Marasmius fiardii PR-910]|nr:hypothetical protein L218DRAFT_625107 [Marasmius fiardii PR-910]